jgi:transcriptional regulator with XRE-family HTH domain
MFQHSNYSINEALKKSISARLIELLPKKGYKNGRKPYYVDIAKFAKELNISSTMLRRYLSGIALPPFHVIEQASQLLNVDPLWLYCGYEQKDIDLPLLKQIIKKMIPIFVKSTNKPSSELDSHIEYLCEIYQHISVITTSDEIERNRLIGWMLEKLLTDNNVSSSENLANKIKELC